MFENVALGAYTISSQRTSHGGKAQVLVAYLGGAGGLKPLLVKVQVAVFEGMAGQWPPHITVTGIASVSRSIAFPHSRG